MITLIAFGAILSSAGASTKISIDPTQPIHNVSPSLYGIFFEEINQAGDGGIYAELLRGRGMEDGSANRLPTGWRASGSSSAGTLHVDESKPLGPSRPRSIRIDRAGSSEFGLRNDGFWGIATEPGKELKLTLWVRGGAGSARLESSDGSSIGSVRWTSATGDSWQKVLSAFSPTVRDTKSHLIISPEPGQSVWVAYASLMPADTWRSRPNGLRKDLGVAVEAMKPAFVRFPGGCYVEGGDRIADAFDWRTSLGPLEARTGIARTMWGYPNTMGLGFHEYLQWCEDLKAEPLFVVNCGMSHREITPLSEMDRWVENALSAIEYANGPVTSKWGSLRAKHGHPKSFKLKYIEIGNENGATWSHGGPPPYADRYKILLDAIKKKHPEIVTIADNPVPHPVEILDEHYYATPSWFWSNANRYDTYDRKGPKIYVGEYAVTQGCGQGNLAAALGEAAFMVGMERNSDIVTMSSYAPLFVNVNNRQWNPNALVYDASRAYGTPSYHVQQMFATNRADRIVKQDFSAPPAPPRSISGTVGLETWETSAEFKDLEVEIDGQVRKIEVGSFKPQRGKWSASDGIIRQTEEATDRIALFPSVSLSGAKKYVYRLKARKVSGREGFIIVMDAADGGSLNWNLGGWGNREHAFQLNSAVISNRLPGRIETGQWYDIRLEREGNRTKGYLDGKLIQEVTEPSVPNFAMVAGLDDSKRELVVKVVNGSPELRSSEIALKGHSIRGPISVITLTGESLNQENTFDRPRAIAPVKSKLTGIRGSFTYEFLPQSVTILRIPISSR